MNKPDGKTVVIAGAASGLGRSLALVLAHKGCRIGVADINIEGAEETLEMVVQRDGKSRCCEADMGKYRINKD